MGIDLFFYSKNKIEKELKISIDKFLTEDIFYDNIFNIYELNHYVHIGRAYCIDENFYDYLNDSIPSNTLYTMDSDSFNKKVKFYEVIYFIELLNKIKLKMDSDDLDKDEYFFPDCSNLIKCLNWLQNLDENDKIILIAV